MTLSITETGSPNGPSIVFLHGGGTGLWMWTQQVADLDDNFHCITLDLPGHSSSAIPWRSLRETADQIAEMIHMRTHGGRCHLVGLSLGGYTALEVIARHPDIVQTAIVSGVTAAPLSLSPLLTFQIGVMNFLSRYRWFVRAQAKYMMQLPDDAVQLYTESAMAMSRESYRTVHAEIMNYRTPKALETAGVPILVVAGGAEMQPIVDAVRELPARLPKATGALAPKLHHGWNGEDPALFSDMIRAWVTASPLPARLEVVVKPEAAVKIS